jgi:hypothetical protein
VFKLLRSLNGRMLAKAAATIPVFLTMLVLTQAKRKIGKWIVRLLGRSSPHLPTTGKDLERHSPADHKG